MKDIARMVLVLVAVCAVAALGLAKVYDLTKEPIREAKRAEMLRALVAVLPDFDNAPDRDVVTMDGAIYYPGTKKGRLTGTAIPVATSEGYGGNIEALVGVDPQGRVTRVAVLAHAETPGLGSKFDDPGYLAQFEGKTLVSTRWAVKKDGGDFDQITGATITPRALVKAMKRGLEGFDKHKAEIQSRGEGREKVPE
jgi:electron transport complex protein RnfG